MLFKDSLPTTLAGVIHAVENSGLPVTRRRDLVSAVMRICEMSGHTPAALQVNPSVLRAAIADIRPAAHRIADGTFANIRSSFAAALASAGVIDRAPRGEAGRDPAWGPLVAKLPDPGMRHGLSSFLNWCAWRGVSPADISDETINAYHLWLETRTLCPKPRDAVARTPRLWNQARDDVPGWPDITLTEVSFRKEPEHLTWDEFDTRYRHDAAAYLEMRRSPDVFDDDPDAPAKPLAESTLRQHKEHLRLAGALLVEKGLPVETLTGLEMLVEIEAFKTILRHYHDKADGKASPFATSMATILKQVAHYHVRVGEAHHGELKRIARCLPTVEQDLTDKMKALLRELEDPACRARLLFLPETLLAAVVQDINAQRLRFVDAQVAIAVDIALVAPLRPQNLVALDWGRHFSQPDGARGRLVLHIPAAETKTGKRDLTFEIPPDVAKRINWYRRHVLPRLNADPNGRLFVTGKGKAKTQATLSQQITETIARHVGVHMTPHAFRHLSAYFYLEAHPEDFETVRALLGHAWSKTTLIYAGSSSQRAGRAYARHVADEREALRPRRRRRPGPRT